MSKRESTALRIAADPRDRVRELIVMRGLVARAPLALVVGALATMTSGCSGRECASGTIAIGDECRPAQAQVQCGPGFKVVGFECRPDDDWVKKYCDPATTEFKSGKCVGTGGPAGPCKADCPAADGNTICVAGRVLEFRSLLTQGSQGATPVKADSGVEVALYDPVVFAQQPGGKPLATVDIKDDNGCFTVPRIEVPGLLPLFAAGVRPKVTGAATPFVQAAIGLHVERGTNLTTAEVVAVNQSTTDAWGVSDLLSKGSLALWYRSKTSGANIDGVKATKGGETLDDVLYLNADGSGIDAAATATSAAGIIIATGALLNTYSGAKTGCSFKSMLSASALATFFLLPIPGEGC